LLFISYFNGLKFKIASALCENEFKKITFSKYIMAKSILNETKIGDFPRVQPKQWHTVET
jgi:hypothetical protein